LTAANHDQRCNARRVAATLYTILETLKLHAVDPNAYLSAALEASERGEALLPWQFATNADRG
jgi:hypothetical protein